MRPLRRLSGLVLAAAFAVAACGSGESTGSENGTASGATGSDAASVLELSAPTVDGRTVDLADYADADLVIWFWAPW